jgi:hypothetical protein
MALSRLIEQPCTGYPRVNSVLLRIHLQSLDVLYLAGDGVYSIHEGGFIKLVDMKTNTTRELVSTADVSNVRAQFVIIALLLILAGKRRLFLLE